MTYQIVYAVSGVMFIDSEHRDKAYAEAHEKVMKLEGSRDCDIDVQECKGKVDIYA